MEQIRTEHDIRVKVQFDQDNTGAEVTVTFPNGREKSAYYSPCPAKCDTLNEWLVKLAEYKPLSTFDNFDNSPTYFEAILRRLV